MNFVDQRLVLQRALEGALAELQRPELAEWRTPDGEPATAVLRRLEQTLERARQDIQGHRSIDRRSLTGLVRWVADWIPDPNHALVAAVGRVQRAALAL